jgi:hypothetical protein
MRSPQDNQSPRKHDSRDHGKDDGLRRKHKPIFAILDEFGKIADCCHAREWPFVFRRRELEYQHVFKLFLQSSGFGLFINRDVNPHLACLCRCGFSFQTKSHREAPFNSELHFPELISHGQLPESGIAAAPSYGVES